MCLLLLPTPRVLRCQTQAARNDFAADGRRRRSVSLGASEGASDPATPQEATSDETWEGEPGQEVVRAACCVLTLSLSNP